MIRQEFPKLGEHYFEETLSNGLLVRVIEKPSRLAGAVWLYEELYRSERGFEVHALLERAGELFYLTLECEAIALS